MMLYDLFKEAIKFGKLKLLVNFSISIFKSLITFVKIEIFFEKKFFAK